VAARTGNWAHQKGLGLGWDPIAGHKDQHRKGAPGQVGAGAGTEAGRVAGNGARIQGGELSEGGH
jgi:hypothetical protein